MNRVGSTFVLLACGTLGAVLAVALLLLIPTDTSPHGYSELIDQELPVLVFAVGMGFGLGVLIALLGSIVQRFFAAIAPRA